MVNKTQVIRIESVLGGESGYLNFSGADEYQASQGIDPDLSLNDYTPSGYIIPSFVGSVGAFSTGVPWFENTPKDGKYYAYGVNGSIFTYSASGGLVGLGDLNDGGTAEGNGFAYYDNYLYAARSTTVARYGPLDGTPAWTDDFWVGTLGKTALTDTTYPTVGPVGISSLNHVMLRHSDGNLYFADVVGNQGVLHKISTTKTTVEGDTDNGSTYNVIDFPYGMYPTALSSYGDTIAIALFEGKVSSGINKKKAKIAFWDPTNPTTYDSIIFSEFPDEHIGALVNSNGVLYTFSGTGDGGPGVRICRFVGGYTMEQIAYLDYMRLPVPGGVYGILNKILMGSTSFRGSTQRGCVIAIGSKLSPVSNKIFNVYSVPGQGGIFAIAPYTSGNGLVEAKILASAYGENSSYYLYRQQLPGGIGGEVTNSYLISQTYRIGSKFKITKLVFNLAKPISSGDTIAITPTIRFDDNQTSTALNTISYTNYGSDQKIIIRPENASGQYNFNLQLDFTGNANLSGFQFGLSLPITIEYELINE